MPRRRTEFLAQRAISRARPGALVVELCCGAGAISAVLLAAVAGIEVHAADIDPAGGALRPAQSDRPGVDRLRG